MIKRSVASARNSPFRYYKQNQHEGGISSPGIVHWPAGLKTKSGSINDTPVHLIDVLPTLADLASTTIPKKHSVRELRQVSGVSLRPILEGGKIERKEPLHFQFANDFALREGDWKIVSFKSQEWELYNLADDRSEIHNLAKEHPGRLQKMVKQWRTMAREVLHSDRLANPKIAPTKSPRTNREWTNYSDSPKPPKVSASRRRGQKKPASPRSIRARKNTTFVREGNTLKLTFTGEDPGIALDLRDFASLPQGPYQLTFDLTSNLSGTGELYFTTDRKSTLPNGTRLTFPVKDSLKAQSIHLEIKTAQTINQLRLDVAQGPGKATLSNLKLMDAQKTVLIDWTAEN